jgi:hypothetical protein
LATDTEQWRALLNEVISGEKQTIEVKKLASYFSRVNIGDAQFDKNILQGDNKLSDSSQGRKFLDQLAKCEDLKMPSPRSVAILYLETLTLL